LNITTIQFYEAILTFLEKILFIIANYTLFSHY
jgi:hypothetical protein